MRRYKIDLTAAESVFLEAIEEVNIKWEPKSKNHQLIKNVISGSHITYRYILMTALLAKSTNESIHTLSLQAQSELEGAYDARSLCHKVIIKIERSKLNRLLGGSNEPFLNKPARFKELSVLNNVKSGNDRLILQDCINVLTILKNKTDACLALKDAIFYTLQREHSNTFKKIEVEADLAINAIMSFTDYLLSQSIGGEVCSVLSAVAFDLFFKNHTSKAEIIIHPINQSGSSKKEIADLEIYNKNTLINCAEIKDKKFTEEDVDHAASKTLMKGFNKVIFVLGPNATNNKIDLSIVIKKWQLKKVQIIVYQLSSFLYSNIALSYSLTYPTYLDLIEKYAKQSKASDHFFKHLKLCLELTAKNIS
jgi:hypothetical protein